MGNSNKFDSKIDPNLRERLLKESKQPFRGLRRALWITLFGSASLGLLIMFGRLMAGDIVSLSDVSIQLSAFIIFTILLWKDRDPNN